MPDSHDPIQAQLITARRTQILDAAAKVFAEKGFHRATIKEIAGVAGISDGTIYNYFDNKEALLIGILNRLDEMESRAEQLEAGLEHSFQDMLAAFLRRHIELYLPNMTMFRAILPEVLVNPKLRALYYEQNVLPTQKMLEAHLQIRVERGELRSIDVSQTARSLSSMLLGSMLLHVFDEEIPPEDMPENLVDLLFSGMQSRDEA